ncbi:MAG: flagellar FlbD family protein [Hungatella sp.]
MIKLSKLNGKEMLLNSDQIEYIEAIPESKIVMMNKEYLLVKESIDEILEKVTEHKRRCYAIQESVIRDCLLTFGRDVADDILKL